MQSVCSAQRRIVYSLCFIFVVAVCSVDSVQAQTKSASLLSPRFLLNDDKYYAAEDLNSAATLLRLDADRLGIDPSFIPIIHNVKIKYFDTLRINLPVVVFEPDIDDRSYVVSLEGFSKSREFGFDDVAIFLISRPLSIDEVASLLEEGVRIYRRIEGGYIVRAQRSVLLTLTEKDYFRGLSQYGPELKGFIETGQAFEDKYIVECFYDVIKDDYISDLTELGVEVVSQSDRSGTLVIRTTTDIIRQVKSLLWVESLIGDIVAVPDGNNPQINAVADRKNNRPFAPTPDAQN